MELWRKACHEHEDSIYLQELIERYTGNNIWRRCVTWSDESGAQTLRNDLSITKRRQKTETLRQAAKKNLTDKLTAKVIFWSMQLPTIGKPIPDCTFSEVADAAGPTNKFLTKLAREGAEGALVREVFKTRKQLQEWGEQAINS